MDGAASTIRGRARRLITISRRANALSSVAEAAVRPSTLARRWYGNARPATRPPATRPPAIRLPAIRLHHETTPRRAIRLHAMKLPGISAVAEAAAAAPPVSMVEAAVVETAVEAVVVARLDRAVAVAVETAAVAEVVASTLTTQNEFLPS